MGPYWLAEPTHVGVFDLLMNKNHGTNKVNNSTNSNKNIDTTGNSNHKDRGSNQQHYSQSPGTTPNGTAATASTTTPEPEVVSPQNEYTAGNIDLRRSYTMPEREQTSSETRLMSAGSSSDDRHVLRHSQSDIVTNHSPIPTTPETPRKLDKFGFIVNIDSRGNMCEVENVDPSQLEDYVPTSAETKHTERRVKKWNATLQSWDRRRQKVLRRRLRKGIPDSMRGKVWVKLGGGIRKPGLYQEILRKTAIAASGTYGDAYGNSGATSSTVGKGGASSTTPLETQPQSVSATNAATASAPAAPQSPSDTSDDFVHTRSFRAIQDTIERDIHRTYPRHNLFYEDDQHADDGKDGADNSLLHGFCDPELASLIPSLEMKMLSSAGDDAPAPGGQEALRRVLRAYSYYDREVGYCQGMNFIAGMFLTLMSEEEAFWLLVAVMEKEPCKMRGLFGEGMRETHMVLHVAERLTQQFLPRLFKHFEKENIHVTMYATQWLLTQYTSSFKFDLVTRVWDCFLEEGWKIIYRIMLALLSQWQTQLLKMTFEEILAFFRELPDRIDGSAVMDIALKIPLRRKHILKYEKDWHKQQQQQQSETR